MDVAAIVDVHELELLITQRNEDIRVQNNALKRARKNNSPESSRREAIERGVLDAQASLEELEARKAELVMDAGSKKRKAANAEILSDLSSISSDDEEEVRVPATKVKTGWKKADTKDANAPKKAGSRQAAERKKPTKEAKRPTKEAQGDRSSRRIAHVEPEVVPEPESKKRANTGKRVLPHAASDSSTPKTSAPTPRSAAVVETCEPYTSFYPYDVLIGRLVDNNPNDANVEIEERYAADFNPTDKMDIDQPSGMEPSASSTTPALFVKVPVVDRANHTETGTAKRTKNGGKPRGASDKEVEKGGPPQAGSKGKMKVASTHKQEARSMRNEKKAAKLKEGEIRAGGDGAESSEPQTDVADDLDDGEDEEDHVFTLNMTARQEKLEERAKGEVERYLRNPKERLTDNVRTHIRTRASHCPEAATSCFPLARDCLITAQGRMKCVYHVLVDKVSKKRDRAGLIALTGVPYPPSKGIPPVQGRPEPVGAYNKCKLPVGRDGQEHCHCGCAIEDAVWGLLLWKTGRIQYMGRANGYEFTRNLPTPAQRNFEITRLKSLGFQLDDFFTHELDAGGNFYRERQRYEIALRQIARLQRELGFGPQLSADGLLKLEPKRDEGEEDEREEEKDGDIV
ncbi:hypothetical protein V5O48_013293 [Marasmius crinis-equi]|uniref:Uncharacterized protein n=1 Tax=Marasmius crinis-equi TaxID=585013 RepID=A0ABR3F0M6_9AGAR